MYDGLLPKPHHPPLALLSIPKLPFDTRIIVPPVCTRMQAIEESGEHGVSVQYEQVLLLGSKLVNASS